MMKFLNIFKKKKRRNTAVFQKHKNATATYKKRKSVSIKIDTGFMKKLSYLYYTIWLLFIGWLVYIFAFSPYFLIKSIQIERQDNHSNIEIGYTILNEYLKDNIFMLDVWTARQQLMDSQENLWKVLISKQFPQTLKVSLTSFPAVYNSIIKEKEHLILANGSAVPGKQEDLPFLNLKFTELPVFYEYKKILSEIELRKIYEIDNLIKLNFATVPYEKINYYIAEKEAHVILESWATIIFDLLWDPEVQIEKLSVFHQENLEITNATLIYTDLRIDGKLYFCTTAEEFNCYNNLNFIYWEER